MKRMIQTAFAVVITACFFISCANTEAKTETVDKEKVKTEIQAMEDAFAAGEKARDVDAVAAYYSDDATSFTRNAPPSVGMAAVKEKIAKDIAEDTTGMYNVYKVEDLFVEGNSATEIGTWTRFNSSGTQVDNGHYMSYFEKRNGKYKCVRDMSVTGTPAK